MGNECRFDGERFSTLITLEWLLAGMYAYMTHQIARFLEAPWTMYALIGMLRKCGQSSILKMIVANLQPSHKQKRSNLLGKAAQAFLSFYSPLG